MMARIFYLAGCGLLLAGIIHIVVILLIPSLSTKDAAKQITLKGDLLKLEKIGFGHAVSVADPDPFFRLSVCKFDLKNTAARITGPKLKDFWSASVFNQRGQVIYSLNDRTAIKNKLDLMIVNPIQMASLRHVQPVDIENSIIVETNFKRGFFVLRTLVRDPSLEYMANEFLENTKCEAYVAHTEK